MAIRAYRLRAGSFIDGSIQNAGVIVRIDEKSAGSNMVLIDEDPEPVSLDALIAVAVDAIEAAALEAHSQDVDVQDLLNEIATQAMQRLNIRTAEQPPLPPPQPAVQTSFSAVNLAPLSTVQLGALSSALLQGLATTQFSALTSVDIAALATVGVSALATEHVQAITTDQISALSSADIATISTTQSQEFSSDQVSALTTVDLAGLTTIAVAP